ncbi:hypothetical protein HNQ02_003738 [Flavobacterium sp. 7E]|uniref:hypothetical protein n=1 Tax=Flavobacterium sp. 7E TaxID=2735898 RepID=UPI00156F3845|nr:hypothetical protein [Flavobacterium sp. 7E]NRS90791.1 hypothetical protein [Flavobacterium sp. 7E]
MGKTLYIAEVDGDTSFQHVTLKITPNVEGDYFDMKGNYLGSTSQSKKNIYIIGRDSLRNPYSRSNLPQNFYDKQASFDGTGNVVNLQAGAKYGTIITDLSAVTRINVAENIYNHYYTEAGFDINRLKYKTITDATDLDRHLSKTEIQERNDRYTAGRRDQLEGTGFAITRVGGYKYFGEYLKELEAEISIHYWHLGKNFDTGYDIMSLCSHEHKHLEDCINDVKNKTKINSEARAYYHQTMVDKNWKFISFRFKAGYYKMTPVLEKLSEEDLKKAFGDKEQYEMFDPLKFNNKNISL